MKPAFAMEVTVPVFSNQGHQELRRKPRRSVEAGMVLRMIVADKAGLASGQVIDLTTRGVWGTPHETSHTWAVPDAQDVSEQRDYVRTM